VLFDWDGVFNNGFKDAEGGSPFSEVDSMGVNLLRFALWLKNGERLPAAGIITGQHNAYAERFAQRERMHGCYMGYTNKPEAFDAFLAAHGLNAEEVAFFFDDVLDLPVAERCGLRVLIGRKASPWFEGACMGKADVITACDGGHHGLREACELLIVASGFADEVLDHRVRYSETYQRYLTQRQAIVPLIELRAR
jgi:3-deoxy-D-manno-octulosonate 8-phosphate phosphatase (KDO 8-P phosphatase)